MPHFSRKRVQRGVIHIAAIFVIALLGVLLLSVVKKTPYFQKIRDILSSQVAANTYSPKVLLLIYNPIIESKGGQKLSQAMGWNDPDILNSTLFQAFQTSSGSVVNYTVAERVEINDFAELVDGFKYTDEEYIECVNSRGSLCHKPDGADYIKVLSSIDACGKRNRDEIDEVWIWAGPWFGFWESNLTGPDAFWYNSSPTLGAGCEKLLPIMGLNYERGEAEALESYAHRVESSMILVYGSWTREYTHNWNKFTMLDVDLPGKGGCGNAHLAVNAPSNTGYNTTDTRVVSSHCDDFLDYPTFAENFKDVDCTTWGCGPDKYLRWWYSHIPRKDGLGPDNRLNNWWVYIIEPQKALEASNTPLLTPPSPSPTASPTATPTPMPTPSITFTNPLNGDTVNRKSNVVISVEVGGSQSISKVEFYIDNSLKCSDTISSYICLWKVPARPKVSYTLEAKAYTSYGETISSSIKVTSK